MADKNKFPAGTGTGEMITEESEAKAPALAFTYNGFIDFIHEASEGEELEGSPIVKTHDLVKLFKKKLKK